MNSGAFCLFWVSCFVFLFCACGRPEQDPRQAFYYNESSGIATLDPAFAKNQSIIWAVRQLYNTLVQTDDALNIMPGLAYRWEMSDDRLQYLFYLRDGVYFHDNEAFPGGKGRKMTAYDVEYSFRRIIDPATASSGAWIFNRRVDSAGGFKALNDSVFQLRLSAPFTPLLGLLSMQYCSVVPREAGLGGSPGSGGKIRQGFPESSLRNGTLPF